MMLITPCLVIMYGLAQLFVFRGLLMEGTVAFKELASSPCLLTWIC